MTRENGYVECDKDGNASTFVGPDGVGLFRLAAMVSGLRLEIKGMRLSRGRRSCYAMAKSEYGLKGNKVKVLAQLEQILADTKAGVEYRQRSDA